MNGMKKTILLMLICLFGLTGCASNTTKSKDTSNISSNNQENIQKGVMSEGLLLNSISKDSIIIGYDDIYAGKKINMNVDLDNDGAEETFEIKRDTPNGVFVGGYSDNVGVNMVNDFDGDIKAFDEFGDLKEGYFLQVTCYDLDHDGIKEVFTSVGDKLIEMQTVLHRYVKNSSDLFEVVGRMWGQEYQYIDDSTNEIIVPYGSQGLFDSYLYTNNSLYTQTN